MVNKFLFVLLVFLSGSVVITAQSELRLQEFASEDQIIEPIIRRQIIPRQQDSISVTTGDQKQDNPCGETILPRTQGPSSDFAPRPDGQTPPWGSRCAMEINRQTAMQKGMFYNSCMAGAGCSRFDWQCRIKRQRFCIDWSNHYEKNPQPASCDLARICKPPAGISLDDWLNGTPQIGSGKPHLPFILRSICIQYFQVRNNKDGKSAVGCTKDELDKELARYYPQCKRPNPKN